MVNYTAKEIAKYFLYKDKERKIFTDKLIELNGRKSYEGNIRLNKYLYFAQTLYLAKNGELLFKEKLLAYDNGPIVKEVLEKYIILQKNKIEIEELEINNEVKTFLDKLYDVLKPATYIELVEISHEDSVWKELSVNTFNAPEMNVKKYQEKYQKQYEGLIKVMGL